MHAPIGADVRWERVYVGTQQFSKAPVIQDGIDDGAAVAQRAEGFFVSGPAAFFGLFGRGVEFQLFEDDFTYLFWGGLIKP
jgi:hypothetical protein